MLDDLLGLALHKASSGEPRRPDHICPNNVYHEDKIDNRQDRNDNDRFHNDSFFFVNSFDNDDSFDDDFFFLPFLFAVEEIDIDCDGFDDDGDLFIDEGADCEIEIEFFEFWD